MPMIDLKLSKRERKDITEPSMDAPEYPWGLNLTLDEEVLEKLGLDVGDFKVGEELPLVGVVKVTSISQHQSDGSASTSVGLTLVKVETGKSDDEKASTLFGDK